MTDAQLREQREHIVRLHMQSENNYGFDTTINTTFVAVRESTAVSKAALLLPNDVRFELPGAVDAETIQSLVTAASSLMSSALG